MRTLSVPSVVHGVVDEVGHGPFDEEGVGADGREVRGHRDDGLLLGGHAGHGGLDELAHVDGPVEDLERAGAQPAEVQQVLDQTVEPVGLFVDRLQQHPGLVGSEGQVIGEQAGGGRP